MNTHELAQLLLAQEDTTVALRLVGGATFEVKQVTTDPIHYADRVIVIEAGELMEKGGPW